MLREPEGRGPDVRLFAPFRLDLRDERLWKGTQELKLRRKPFAILRHLTLHPQRLVTQEELVEAVWGKIAMSESLLRTHVSELRRVMGEDVIETVVGRGYRFLRDVEAERPATPARMAAAPPVASKLVGRDRERGLLAEAYARVLEQERHVVFVTGEPGIGKTALVDDFLALVAARDGALVARGACVEQFGAGEAYLPVLDAVGALCRGPDGVRFVDVLGRHAPTWLAQMSGLVSDEKLAAIMLRVQGATQARMLRELAEALDVLAMDRPVVLALEDMQWSDPSTTDLVAMLGGRRERARVAVVATCRPAELSRGEGLAKVMGQLSAHKQATVVHVESWSEEAVAAYLAQRFAGASLPRELAATVRKMTGGNPLFVGAVVDDLEGRGTIRSVEGGWQLTESTDEVADHRPDTVRQLIDIQIDRLKSSDQRILEAASVAGQQFTAGTVACALALAVDEVDSACEGLASDRRGFLHFVATEPWPDGTIQSRYAFVHALHRDAALARVPATTKRAWHRRIAEGLEAAHRSNGPACLAVEEVAAELAIHFDEAQAFTQAVRYYCAAGERAMRRFGRAEALGHFDRARALVSRLPPSDESERAELLVLKQLGPALIAQRGFQDPNLEAIFDRTADLARKLGDDRAALDALLGLARFHILQGHLRAVEPYEAQVAPIVARLSDPVAAAEAAVVSLSARLFRGQLEAVRAPLTEACGVLDAAGSDPARVVNAPIVGLWGGHMVVLTWLSGAPDSAMAAAAKMRAHAEAAGDPFHLSTALTITALTHKWRREPEKTHEVAGRALVAAREAGSPVWLGRALSLHHWAATALDPGSAEAHYQELSTRLRELLRAGPYGRTAFTPCFVLVCAEAGHADVALREIEEALAFADETDERAWASELHRLRGELVRARDPAAAERSFGLALEVARQQGARSFELRAALSLAKLEQRDRRLKKRPGLEALRRSYAAFTEGLETGDLVEARSLLDPPR